MGTDWDLVNLREICDIFDGPHATPQKTTTGPIFLGISSLKKGRIDLSEAEYLSEADYKIWTHRVTPTKDDVVFSYETRLGEVAILPDGFRACLGRRMGLLRAKTDRVVPKYLLYAYQGDEFQETIRQKTIHGCTVNRIPLIEMPDFPIRLPPLYTQEAIAHILGTLDDKIELLHQMNETLEAMARALFKSWFVDFEPVRKKAEGLPTGLPSEIDALFPESFEDSEMGEIPKGWTLKPLGKVIEIAGGSTPSTKEASYWGGTYKFATPRDLSRLDSPILTDTERSITKQGVSQISSAQLPIGTLLLSSRAPIGYLALTDTPISINQGFIAVRKESLLPPQYMYFWCKENMETIIGNANGTTFLEISKSSFRTIKVVLPQNAIVDQFFKEASVMFSTIAKNTHENKTLLEIRDSLLPKLISGDLEVKDIDKILEPAT